MITYDSASADTLLQRLRSSQSQAGDVLAFLHFYNPPADGSEPFFEVTDPSGAGRKNHGHNPVPVTIQDMRNREKHFSLSRHSVAAVSEAAIEVNLDDIDRAKESYALSAVEILLKHVSNSQKVIVFDRTVRKASPTETLCKPVRKVHIDQTPGGALGRVKRHLSSYEAEEIQASRLRVRIINVWRPLLRPVSDHPLAVAEALTISDTDLVKVKHIYPEATGENFVVKYNPSQRFWYWSNMSTRDVLLLQCFDSQQYIDDSGSPRDIRCAHASISPLTLADEKHSRQSIEVRCLVLG